MQPAELCSNRGLSLMLPFNFQFPIQLYIFCCCFLVFYYFPLRVGVEWSREVKEQRSGAPSLHGWLCAGESAERRRVLQPPASIARAQSERIHWSVCEPTRGRVASSPIHCSRRSLPAHSGAGRGELALW